MEEQRIYGLKNEDAIISYLNNKAFSMLNSKWKEHIKTMFPFVKDDDLIEAKHFLDASAKPDMVLKIRHTTKYVSIKTGNNPSVHQESYHSFRRFLKSRGVSYRTLEIIRFFHFGDSMKLGTTKPMTVDEMKEKYSSYFLEAAKAVDTPEIISAVIDRAVIKGTENHSTRIDYLYYGDLEHGNLLTVEDIYSIILSYREHGKSPIHFGGLNYNPNSRNNKRRERNYVRIRWPMLSFLYFKNQDDIEMMKTGDFKGSYSELIERGRKSS